jgi:hypothetical protein
MGKKASSLKSISLQGEGGTLQRDKNIIAENKTESKSFFQSSSTFNNRHTTGFHLWISERFLHLQPNRTACVYLVEQPLAFLCKGERR